jgi:hypothetical protein
MELVMFLFFNEEKKLCGIGDALLVQTGSAFKNKVDFLKNRQNLVGSIGSDF